MKCEFVVVFQKWLETINARSAPRCEVCRYRIHTRKCYRVSFLFLCIIKFSARLNLLSHPVFKVYLGQSVIFMKTDAHNSVHFLDKPGLAGCRLIFIFHCLQNCILFIALMQTLNGQNRRGSGLLYQFPKCHY